MNTAVYAATPSPADYADTAECLWKEARGEGIGGMIAVGCVLRNRVKRHYSSYSIEVFRPWQFTSMTDPNDPEYRLKPDADSPLYPEAQAVARSIIDEAQQDVTGGATLYWNPDCIKTDKAFMLPGGEWVRFPETWNPNVIRFSRKIGHHIFLTEV